MVPIFAALLLLFSRANGMGNTGSVRYSVSIRTPCSFNPDSPTCCAASLCRMRYRLSGSWETKKEVRPTPLLCQLACHKHLSQCENACECLADTEEVESSTACLCRRPRCRRQTVFNRCYSRCSGAYEVCVRTCASGRCPLVARTVTSLSLVVGGSCHLYCPPPSPLRQILASVKQECREA